MSRELSMECRFEENSAIPLVQTPANPVSNGGTSIDGALNHPSGTSRQTSHDEAASGKPEFPFGASGGRKGSQTCQTSHRKLARFESSHVLSIVSGVHLLSELHMLWGPFDLFSAFISHQTSNADKSIYWRPTLCTTS